MSGAGEGELSREAREGGYPHTQTMSVTGDVTGEEERSVEEETTSGSGARVGGGARNP